MSGELAQAWRDAFAGTEVVVEQASILSVAGDAIVSPANSFGYMDGGLDLLYSQHFGWEVEKRLRRRLIEEWDGELPVGNAVIVPVGVKGVEWLVSAPTMRVPMNVANTAHAFLAFRAALRASLEHNRTEATPIRILLCPGLGTGEGRMPAKRCARQMRRAYDVVHRRELVLLGGLAGAVRDHMALIE